VIRDYLTSFIKYFPQHQISPEVLNTGKGLYPKRLLRGSFVRVFEIKRNFRYKRRFMQHNPELSMLEFNPACAIRLSQHLKERSFPSPPRNGFVRGTCCLKLAPRKKPGCPLRQPGCLTPLFWRPVAFRPRLAAGLALSEH
jgi:hypothetical protein